MARAKGSPIAKHHVEWLSLVETSGPFLSMPVLERVFPQGLPPKDREVGADLRIAFGEYKAALGTDDEATYHTAWVRFVLRDVLGYPDEVLKSGQALPQSLSAHLPEHGETIRPDYALTNPADAKDRPDAARLLVATYPARQKLHSPVHEARSATSPAARMMSLLHATDVRLGLVTNGEEWMIVHAKPGESTGYASFYPAVFLEEPLTLRAFMTLLEVDRFFGGPDETPERLFADSAEDQQDVTDQLGRQVRSAVEILVHELDRIDRDRKRELLAEFDDKRLYEAAVTVMMRLVFLFSAEERDLLLLGEPIYDQHYAVSTLRAQLREIADKHGEEILERRFDAWARLLATFRAVHGGVEHGRLRLRPYGGSLFDPDRFPFLEGRPAKTKWRQTAARPLPIHNRTVLHLLDALQMLEVPLGRGLPPTARRLSFKALDIEQIGHVYEGLLDHTAARATETVLGLAGGSKAEPEIPLAELEAALEKGPEAFAEAMKKRLKKNAKSLAKAVTDTPTEVTDRLRIACEHDDDLVKRVLPFSRLLRTDSFDVPLVLTKDSVYVTAGTDRRTSGTHYTPRTLTEPIVKHTLDPLVYDGPAEGKPEAEWRLKSAQDILRLRVCDMAMGSGAFLVQACRYLAARLDEAWRAAEKRHGGQLLVTPSGEISTGAKDERLLPKDEDERLVLARRAVASRCLYGVDKNPMATEMAKLSLWLVTLEKNKPFTFVDHALRTGDSLIGISDPAQVRHFHVDPTRGKKAHHDLPLFDDTKYLEPLLRKAVKKRQELEGFLVDDVRDAERKARLLEEAEAAIDEVSVVCDLIVAGVKRAGGQVDQRLDDVLTAWAPEVDMALKPGLSSEERSRRFLALRRRARAELSNDEKGPWTPLHWLAAFPEVFMDEKAPGFDAFVGNPPFQGGQKITGAVGTDYREWLVSGLAAGARGSADLCGYFFLRAYDLLREPGTFGLIATNTIAQGDTREVGLDQLTERGAAIMRATPSEKWPGDANLEVAKVWLRKGEWAGDHVLEGKKVSGIGPYLVVPGKAVGKPYRLAENAGKSFQGSIVLGMGFVLTPEEAQALIDKDPRNKDVLFPYLNGKDLNSSPTQSPSRWVINFFDWPLEKAETYPDCMKIVREKVKPEREKNNRKVYRDYWWHYAEKRPKLYSRLAKTGAALVVARTAKYRFYFHAMQGNVFDVNLVVFLPGDASTESLFDSSIKEAWVGRSRPR